MLIFSAHSGRELPVIDFLLELLSILLYEVALCAVSWQSTLNPGDKRPKCNFFFRQKKRFFRGKGWGLKGRNSPLAVLKDHIGVYIHSELHKGHLVNSRDIQDYRFGGLKF